MRVSGSRLRAQLMVKGGVDKWKDIRVLVDELGGIVDLIVDYQVDVLLGVVLGNILVGEFERHGVQMAA